MPEKLNAIAGAGMSSVTLPVNRPIGRALVVGSASARPASLKTLAQLGFECGVADDPYRAFVELSNHRLAYHALILSLTSLYREELAIITTVKKRLQHVDIWLTQTDGRQAALAEGISLGADGLLADDGLHRIATQPPTALVERPVEKLPLDRRPSARPPLSAEIADIPIGEPVLTSDELRALLQDQPMIPPYNSAE